MTVADFSMKMEGRIENNGNQEKGKEEKEALRKLYEVETGGRQKRPLSFCGESPTCPIRSEINQAAARRSSLDSK
jgi:hypothetical protein